MLKVLDVGNLVQDSDQGILIWCCRSNLKSELRLHVIVIRGCRVRIVFLILKALSVDFRVAPLHPIESDISLESLLLTFAVARVDCLEVRRRLTEIQEHMLSLAASFDQRVTQGFDCVCRRAFLMLNLIVLKVEVA